MRSFVLTLMVLALVVSVSYASHHGSPPVWPTGAWMTAVVVTDDTVHEAEAGVEWTSDTMAVIKAGGNDIWDAADQFTFVYQELSGDFDVALTVHALENTNDWAKAGLMARQNVEPGAKNVGAFARGADDLVTFQNRPEADAGSGSERVTPDGAPRPVTIRLYRVGDEFEGGWSLDGGATWEEAVTRDGVTPTPPAIVMMDDPILVGIAVTSHATGVITTAEVELVGWPTGTAVDAQDKLSLTWGTLKSVQ